MKVNELLSEEQLNELDVKRLGRAAAVAAGVVGGAMLASPSQDISVTSPIEITQAQIKQDKSQNLPKNLEKMTPDNKKKAFLDFIVPIAKKLNIKILKQRKIVIGLKTKEDLTSDEKQLLEKLMREYKTDNIDTLLVRLDIIPVSLIVAQSVIESGWGTSRFAQQGNSLFGQRDYSGSGIKPKHATGFTVAKFDTIPDSVKSYLNNLNTHKAYKKFRNIRKYMRDNGENIDSLRLVKGLTKYSERGLAYVQDVASIIKSNKLQKYDQLT